MFMRKQVLILFWIKFKNLRTAYILLRKRHDFLTRTSRRDIRHPHFSNDRDGIDDNANQLASDQSAIALVPQPSVSTSAINETPAPPPPSPGPASGYINSTPNLFGCMGYEMVNNQY